MSDKKYGWYSERANELHGHAVWRRPDGTEVAVISVSATPDDSGTYWKDVRCVGEVTQYLWSCDRSMYESYPSPRCRPQLRLEFAPIVPLLELKPGEKIDFPIKLKWP